MPGDPVDGNVMTTFAEQARLVSDLLEYRICVKNISACPMGSLGISVHTMVNRVSLR